MSDYSLPIDYNSAFPTGNALLDSSVVVSAIVDSETITLGNVIGALSTLYNAKMFTQYGIMTPDEMAEYYNGMEIMVNSLCTELALCIENNQSVRDAILGVGGGNGGIGNTGGVIGGGVEKNIPSNIDNTTNLIAGIDCTDDRMFAIASGMVATIFDVITTFYESVEIATNGLELAGALSDNAPSWITGTIATGIEITQWLQDTAFEAFNLYDTIAKRSELSCELYCIMKDNSCSITYDDIAQWAIGLSAIEMIGERLDGVLAGIALTASPSDVGTASIAVMFATLNLGSRFGGIAGATGFSQAIRIYYNDDNPDWVFCDPCSSSWSVFWDIEQTNPLGFTYIKGSWATPSAWYSATPAPTEATLEKSWSPITGALEFGARVLWDGVNRTGQGVILQIWSGGIAIATLSQPPTGGDKVYTWDLSGYATFDKLKVFARPTTGFGGSMAIESMYMDGDGGTIPT